MKEVKTEAFVNENANFILLIRGEQKKLVSRDELYEKLEPLAVDTNDDFHIIVDPNDKYYNGILYKKNPWHWDLVRIAQRFAHVLWPENEPA